MRPPTVGAIGRELSSTSTAHNWVRDGGWPRGWPPWESQAWEADTLPAELLPLGATGVIADRARGANGNPAASALRSLEWLRRYGTLAPHRPGAEPQLASVDIDPVALRIARENADRNGAVDIEVTDRPLERIAEAKKGVEKCYAIQAGREVRVVVNPQAVTDEQARELAKQLRRKIEEELQYPSTIKITVIREQRFNETAM